MTEKECNERGRQLRRPLDSGSTAAKRLYSGPNPQIFCPLLSVLQLHTNVFPLTVFFSPGSQASAKEVDRVMVINSVIVVAITFFIKASKY
jgi:hypothetical protein